MVSESDDTKNDDDDVFDGSLFGMSDSGDPSDLCDQSSTGK